MNPLSRLKDSGSILHGAVILGSGAAVAQLVNVGIAPVLTRIYSPAEMGIFALYFAFVSVAFTIAPLGFQQALPSAKTRREAAVLGSGVAIFLPVMCVVVSLAQLLLIRHRWLGFGDLPVNTVWLTGLGVFATTLLSLLQFWFIREEQYPVISRTQATQSAARAVLQSGLGLAGASIYGLLIGDSCGRLLGLSGMMRSAWPDFRRAVSENTLATYRATFWEFRKFFFPQLPSIVINIVARMLPVPLLVHHFGVESAGLFAMADRVMRVPVSFISQSVGNALHGRIGTYSRTNPPKILNLFLKATGGLFAIGLVPTLVIALWGEPIFSTVLGERWRQAGEMAALLAPWALSMLVVSTTSRVVFIFQAFATAFWYNVASLLFTVGVFLVGARQGWSVLTTVTWLTRLGVLAYLIYYVLLLLVVRKGIADLNSKLDHPSANSL